MTLRNAFITTPILLVFSTLTFAAEKINKPASHGEKISSITLTRDVVSPDDAVNQIHAIADKKGADHYTINSILPASRNGSSLRVNADFYRC
ncbi:DUF1471 domain-containing protein [Serratia quinivorans]|uniref:DUF1471 domain-containing protein n=1 Tax=Serratia quinivorans TaxID=137545 RepID=UPI0034C60EEF